MKAIAEEMKALADATQVLKSTMDLIDGEASRPEGALCRSLSASISVVVKFDVFAGKDLFAKVKELITELINRLVSEASTDAS